jgi:hypothetical protein
MFLAYVEHGLVAALARRCWPSHGVGSRWLISACQAFPAVSSIFLWNIAARRSRAGGYCAA